MARGVGDDFDRGRKVGKYEIVTRLSVGGMAELYLAVLPGPGGFQKFVALKQILPDVRRDEAFVKMFLDEARVTGALSHPNIGQVFELGHDPESGELYLAMEFIQGQTLREVVQRAYKTQTPLPWGFCGRVVRDACLGLHSAHSFVDPVTEQPSPVIHRDVSPANVMVSFSGLVKVIDFGIAKARGRLARTQVGMVKGTTGYMSPEQALDEPLDARSDVFSAGVILYELLAGRVLYDGSGTEQMRRVTVADAPSLRDVAPELPQGLSDVVMRALTRDRAQRWANAREFARAVESATPDFFDEEQLAEFMRRLFPDTVALNRSLLDAAQAGAPDGAKLANTADALKAASRAKDLGPVPASRTTAPVSAAPPAAQASSGAVTAQRPARRAAALTVAVGGGLVIAAAGAFLLWPEGETARGSTPHAAMEQLEERIIPQARAAIAARDPTRARQLLDSCRIGAELCPAAAPLLAELTAQAKAEAAARAREEPEPGALSPLPLAGPPAGCDVDRARALLQKLESEEAVELLRACTTPKGLDQRAAALLRQLNGEATEHKSLLAARAALDDKNLDGARQALRQAQGTKLLRPAYAELSRRADALAVELGAARGGSKVEIIRGAALAPAPVPAGAPARGSTTAEGLLAASRVDAQEGDLASAIGKLEVCTRLEPAAFDCWKGLGSLYAKRGGAADLPRAMTAYERFLALAPASHPDVPKVRRLVLDYRGSR